MKVTLSTKGQIVLPAKFLQQDGIEPGQSFRVERIQAGKYLLKRELSCGNARLVEWLRACPVDHWFTPIPSETTDGL